MTDKIWRLYCPSCGWKGEENTAMNPICPECKTRLRMETPPYDFSEFSSSVMAKYAKEMVREDFYGIVTIYGTENEEK